MGFLFGNEQAKPIDKPIDKSRDTIKKPQSGSTNLVTDPSKTKGEKQVAKTDPKTLTNEEAQLALGISENRSFGIA